MNKFRASYSVLSTWATGDYDRAIKMYFKLETITSKAMEAGKELHEQWQKEIETTKCLPVVFGSKPLNNPETEVKRVVQIFDWLELVGVPDCVDGENIYEFKSGKSKDSEAYANDQQVGIYGLILALDKRKTKMAYIYHLDQYSKKMDMSMVHITPELLQKTMDWVESMASDMHNYLTVNNLYQRFQK